MTSAHVDVFPRQITLPLVVAVYASGGTEHDPVLYVVAKSPEGERLGSLEIRWQWPDTPGAPLKHWVTTRPFPFQVTGPGTYSIGLYETPDAADTDVLFPLTVLKFNPLTAPRS
ncbi:hypothetical protein [Mycolicibacterium sediminis]|nr:hypothetical protein [Mycolicibacterium sediminis]